VNPRERRRREKKREEERRKKKREERKTPTVNTGVTEKRKFFEREEKIFCKNQKPKSKSAKE